MIKNAFEEDNIRIAFPTVYVEDGGDAATLPPHSSRSPG
jgi:hypothetical protein